MKAMTPKEQAIAALEIRIPDEVPIFELEFQLEEESATFLLRECLLKGIK